MVEYVSTIMTTKNPLFSALFIGVSLALAGAGCVNQTPPPVPETQETTTPPSDGIVHDAVIPGKDDEIMAVIAADLGDDVQQLKYYNAFLSSQNERLVVVWGTAGYENPSAIATFVRVYGGDYKLVKSFAGGVGGDLNHGYIANVSWEDEPETVVGYDVVTVDEGGTKSARKTFSFDSEVATSPAACPSPTMVAVSTGSTGDLAFTNGSLHPDVGEVQADASTCAGATCLVMTQQQLFGGSPFASDAVFFFTRPVSSLDVTVCGNDTAMSVHGYVDTPGAQQDETRSVSVSGAQACTDQHLTFHPAVNRATFEGNDADTDQTWAIRSATVSWSCE